MIDLSVRDELVEKLEAENDELRAHIKTLEAEVFGRGFLAPVEWGLTLSESKVFGALVQRDVATKELIMTALYRGLGSDEAEIKIVDVFICKMRKKLKPYDVEIMTLWGRGYYLPPALRTKYKVGKPEAAPAALQETA